MREENYYQIKAAANDVLIRWIDACRNLAQTRAENGLYINCTDIIVELEKRLNHDAQVALARDAAAP